jgi:hypothetical protein
MWGGMGEGYARRGGRGVVGGQRVAAGSYVMPDGNLAGREEVHLRGRAGVARCATRAAGDEGSSARERFGHRGNAVWAR